MVPGQRSTAAGTAAALLALLLAAPAPGTALARLSDASASGDPTAPLVAAVALVAWAVTAWLALTVVVVLLSRAPGLLGRSSAAVARRLAPAAVRRAVEAVLGVTVAMGVLAPATAIAAPVTGPSTRTGPTADAGWDLDWPSLTGAASSAPAPAGTGAPTGPAATTVARPAAAAPTATRAPLAAPTPSAAATPALPTSAPRSTAWPTSLPSAAVPPPGGRSVVTPADVPPTPDAPPPRTVVVQPGDSLWALAEASLRRAGTPEPSDRQVALAWPQWWSANRAVIGDDPDLLLPGTVLRPPAGSADPR